MQGLHTEGDKPDADPGLEFGYAGSVFWEDDHIPTFPNHASK